MSSGIVLDNTVLSVFKRLGEIGLLKKILAIEKNCVFATDDRRARIYANKAGIRTTGTIGILIAGISKGVITKQKAMDVLNNIKDHKMLYLSDEIFEYAKSKISE